MVIKEGIEGALYGLRTAREIHDHGKYWASHIPESRVTMDGSLRITDHPASAKVGENVFYAGVAALPVKITSDGEYIRTVDPINGVFKTILVFSEPGAYHVTFTSGVQTVTVDIEISK